MACHWTCWLQYSKSTPIKYKIKSCYAFKQPNVNFVKNIWIYYFFLDENKDDNEKEMKKHQKQFNKIKILMDLIENNHRDYHIASWIDGQKWAVRTSLES